MQLKCLVCVCVCVCVRVCACVCLFVISNLASRAITCPTKNTNGLGVTWTERPTTALLKSKSDILSYHGYILLHVQFSVYFFVTRM